MFRLLKKKDETRYICPYCNGVYERVEEMHRCRDMCIAEIDDEMNWWEE